MSSKQIKAKLDKLMVKIKNRQTELATLKTQAKDLKTQLAQARQDEKTKAAAGKNPSK